MKSVLFRFARVGRWLRAGAAAALVLSLGTSAALAQGQLPPAQPRVDANVIPTNLTRQGEQSAAVVNGENISINEVQKILDARPPSAITLTQEQRREMQKAAVEMLVNDTLIRQFLAKQVQPPGKNELMKEVDDLKSALAKSNKTIEAMLKDTNTSWEQLQRDMVTRLQWKAYLSKAMTEDQAREYYNANKPFFDKVFVRASHVLVRVDPKATPDQKAQARKKIEAIKDQIVTKKVDFATAARSWSDCPSKEKDGDIGPFPFKFMVVDNFARVAFSMQVGQMSDIVETEFGYHLIRVTDRTPGQPTRYEDQRDVVREVWAQDRDLHGSILQQMQKNSQVKILVQ